VAARLFPLQQPAAGRPDCLLALPPLGKRAEHDTVFAAPEEEEEEEEGVFRGGDGAWHLQSKQGERKKHESFQEFCCSTLP